MEDYDNSCETDEYNYIGKGVLTRDATGGVKTIEPAVGVPREEPSGSEDIWVLVEDIPLEETKRYEEDPAAEVDPIEPPQGVPSAWSDRGNMEVPHGSHQRTSDRNHKPVGSHIYTYE